MGTRPLLAWPGWGLLGYTLFLGICVSLWWVLIFHGADALTGLHPWRVRVHFDFELAIPLVPPLILVYFSLDILFWMAPFILRSRRELQALALALIGVTGIAGVCFVLIPAEVAYAPARVDGIWKHLFALNRLVVLRHNLVPSLHVGMSSLMLETYCTHAGWKARLLFAAWAGAIALATTVIHEHHLLDVAAGLGLSYIGRHFIYERRLERRPEDREAPPSPANAPVHPV